MVRKSQKKEKKEKKRALKSNIFYRRPNKLLYQAIQTTVPLTEVTCTNNRTTGAFTQHSFPHYQTS